MKTITLAATALALVTGILTPAGAQTPSALPRTATLTVSGAGSVTRAPDRAIVRFSIVTSDDVSTRATSANNAAYNVLTAKLAALGVNGAAVKTTNFSVAYSPRPAAPDPQQGQRYGYVVSRSVAVTDERTDRVGTIIDAGVSGGVTEIEGVDFTLRDGRAAYRAALAAAFADADAQARVLGAAAHVRLRRILSIGDGTASPIARPMFAAEAFNRSKAAAVPTDVQPTDLTIDATVTVVYEIAP